MLVGAAAILLVGLLSAAGSEPLGSDFRSVYLPAAEAVRDGGSPYPAPESKILEEERAYVYPPQLAFALVPLTFLPIGAAALLAFLVTLGALAGALALVGVRDVRCYSALLLWAPAWNALETANLSAALALALALAWRHRDDVWRPAIALGLAISAKLLLWPVLVWMLATRRERASVLAVSTGFAVSLVSWSALGFADFTSYPELLRRLSDFEAEKSYSLAGVAGELGFRPAAAGVLMLLVGGGFLVACIRLGRRGDDRRAFTCAIAAALSLTPVVWQHYLVILAVPLALSHPRFSAVWLLPIALWMSPRAGNGDGFETLAPAVVVAILLVVLVRKPRARASGPEVVRA
jgi:hypothetical protein